MMDELTVMLQALRDTQVLIIIIIRGSDIMRREMFYDKIIHKMATQPPS